MSSCDHVLVSMGVDERRPRPPLQRPRSGRLIAGVCVGLADHLRLPPFVVRLVMVITTAAGGAGVVAYAGFWLLVPLPDRELPTDPRRRPGIGQVLALAAVGIGTLGLTQTVWLGADIVWPAATAAVGAAVVWRQIDDLRSARAGATAASPAVRRRIRGTRLVWVAAGVVLLLIGLSAFVVSRGEVTATRRAIVPIALLLGGVALVTGPWWLQTARELTAERRARIREQERVQIAGHLHDGVLQTLTLIQRRAEDPREVLRLARASERDLRRWLYRSDSLDMTSLRVALEQSAAEVEDDHGVPIEVVAVGDAALDPRVGALVQAAREAMVNAAKSSGAAAVSVFAEVDKTCARVFIRDRGRGFDPTAIPPDRWGIRESIIARMEREHGQAEVQSAVGDGTEIRLSLPLRVGEHA